jgi:hypothetical protein
MSTAAAAAMMTGALLRGGGRIEIGGKLITGIRRAGGEKMDEGAFMTERFRDSCAGPRVLYLRIAN